MEVPSKFLVISDPRIVMFDSWNSYTQDRPGQAWK